VAKRKTPSLTWIYFVALVVVALPTVLIGAYLASRGITWSVLAAGCAGVVLVTVTYPIARVLEGWRTTADENVERVLTPFTERMQEFSMLLNQIAEQQLISDRGKSVAFRDKDRDALRRALREEMSKKDYEAALVLVDDMERVFGYKQEADRFRQEIELKRNEVVRRQIAEAVGMVERCCRDEGWPDALNEANRIAQLYPNDEQARELPAQVETRRLAHKRQLLDSYYEAKRRNDVDGGVEILRRLDLYLNPAEAASMQEDARAMFRTKLHNLGEQFTVAYREGRNTEALRIGEQIVQDFPNSRMADEVNAVMGALRQKASEPANATA
jgi:hypothetical protein